MSFWFDPMVQTAGMPGYHGAVEQGQAYNASIAAQQAQRNATLAQANAYNPWGNTPGGFGGQTAHYAGLGAAYGRAVQPKMSSVFDRGAAPFRSYGLPGGGGMGSFSSWAPRYSGGGIGSDARYGGQNTLADFTSRYQSMLSPARSGGIGSDAARAPNQGNYWNTYSRMMSLPNARIGGIGSDARYGGQNAALAALYRGGGIGSDMRYGRQNTLPSFNSLWSGRGAPAVARDNSWFNAPTVARQMMPQYDFLDRFRGMQSPAGRGGIGSDARFGAQQSSPYGAALDMLRAGRGWTIANTPSPASQGGLANRINQGIYDIGNAGNAYNRSIGGSFGGFGMNLPGRGQGLTPQDLAIPHAYPPWVRR